MSESVVESLDRVTQMASGDLTWDLSENDRKALRVVLKRFGELEQENLSLYQQLCECQKRIPYDVKMV